MTANEMVQYIGKRLGIPELCLNEMGLCRIRLNDSIVIDFEEDDTKNWLHVFAALTDDAANLSRDTLLKLLRAHYLFNDTAHASFGLDAEDRLCLFMRAPTSEMAEELWVEMFEAFFPRISNGKKNCPAEQLRILYRAMICPTCRPVLL